MSVYGIMRTSVSGMNAQANRLSAVSENIANANTNGYKRATTEFSSLVLPSGPSEFNSGVVETRTRNLISQQGGLSYTSGTTDLAISGKGFMVVNDAQGSTFLTRAGSFVEDANGDLINAGGFKLMGYPLPFGDVNGVANGFAGLQPVNLKTTALIATPTTEGVLALNLADSADTGGLPAVYNAGRFDATGLHLSDSIQFDLTVDGGVTRQVKLVTTAVNTASPAALRTGLQAAIDAAVGVGKIVVAADADRNLTFTTVQKGANASIVIGPVSAVDGDDVLSSKLGMVGGDSGVVPAGAFATSQLGTFNNLGRSIGDVLTFSVTTDAGPPVDISVALTEANTDTPAAFQIALQDAINLAGIDAEVVRNGDALSLKLDAVSGGSLGANNRIQVSAFAVTAGTDGLTTTLLGLSAGGGAVAGAPRILPSSNDPAASYTAKKSMVTYDDVGNEVVLDIFMTKTAPNTWEMAVYNRADAPKSVPAADFPYAAPPLTTSTLVFNGSGELASAGGVPGSAAVGIEIPGGQTMSLDISSITQLGTDFKILDASVNGNPPSEIKDIRIGSDGVVSAVFSTGTSRALYKIPLATVESPDNMRSLSGNVYSATAESGAVLIGFGEEAGMGALVSGALELSTVDLASELTTMIEAQRGYTANSKVFQSGSEILDVLVNLKR